jgi:hypothetical protein
VGPLRLALVLLLLALALQVGVARADEVPPALGETRWLGPTPFQYVGLDERGRALWLYPHQDGVPELFVADGPGALQGSLESRYDPATGALTRRFSAVEALNELVAADGARERRAPARVLAAFLALTPSVPYYLRDAEDAVAGALTPEDAAWVEATVARQRLALARAPEVGTRVQAAPDRLLTVDDHYAALTFDGFLDVVVVGGNSRDAASGAFYSWDLVAALSDELSRAGFSSAAFREADDRTLREKTVVLRGRPTRVRVQLTGGSSRQDRVRRNVANFVEGLARADVVIYLGHSNKDSGSYYLAESKTSYSRFHIGGDGDDLAAKCHQLGRRAHQVVVLQSCSSWPKYAQPLTAFFRAAGAAVPGLVGTTELAYFDEFVPRYRALLELLLAGAGPRALADALRAAPRRPDAAPTLLRGVLQPRATFVVPAGVSIVRTDDLGPDDGFQVVGEGSDGQRYPSTEVFPQDRPGDVVQAVACGRGVFGLHRDGSLRRVGPETKGDCLPVPAPGLTLRYLARVARPGGERLCALDDRGRVHVVQDGALVPLEPPAPAPLVALGNDARGRVVGRAADERWFVWRAGAKTWDETTAAAAALVGAAPSLASRVTPGVLWLGVAEQGRVVR